MSRIEQALEKAAHLRNTPDGSVVKAKNAGNVSVQPIRQHTPPAPPDGAAFKTSIDNPLLATLCDPHSPVSEEYRKLKSVVSAFAQQGEFKNVIMVTSSVSSEGKSITSLNLAITLAQEFDHTVLLVDADLRKPSLQDYLGMKPGKGLSDYLKGEAPLGELLIKSGIGRLTLMPAGTPVKNPVELFSSQKLRDFITEIKNRYPDRFIIIDTPPLLPFAETRSLGALADGVVFVIREGVVTPANLREAMDTLDNTKIIGTVFNEATQASLNGHYHYYGYGYSYGGKLKGSRERQDASSNGKPVSGGLLSRFFRH